jgi:UrcA family protein
MNILIASSGRGGLIATLIVGAFASSVGATFAADENLGSSSQIVKFADLNITTPPGAAVLYGRIQAAAVSTCSFFVFQSDAAETRCINDAIAKAVTKVNEPALFAVYNAKNKTLKPMALMSQSR